MNRPIEDRLVAALAARAEQVRPEDLEPIEVPERSRRPRPVVVLLMVAAACAVVIALPFVLGGGDDDSAPVQTPSVSETAPSPSEPTPEEPTPTTPTTEPPGATLIDQQRADVDGDGQPDTVRLVLQGNDPEEPGEGTLSVDLGSGSGGGTYVPFGYLRPLEPPLDLNGDGREQVLLQHTAGGDSAQLLVFTWHEGGIVQAQYDGDAFLGLELDGSGKVADYYVDEGALYSWLRGEPVGTGPVYEVEQWSWSINENRLEATPAGNACVDVTTEATPQPC